eukprot:NODE_892_length_1573_cov_85.687414_g881_i0.p1 GENE.NODE_892_length_1573_cov_85.687414_g881_i0~~NODE_892_length_1573_cov_85.687414_g881_i0.p1  ORF type:complete len:494 (-),score=112.77 NODE_892_length_1573_cov_85.687414_g881_i0:31-1512(-)
MLRSSVFLAVFIALLNATPLDDYVNHDDGEFKWFNTNVTYNFLGGKGYLLNLTSQRWLTDADSDRSIWTHQLVVVVPDKLQYDKDSAFLWITGGENRNPEPPSPTGEDVLLTSLVAINTGTIGAALFQVPNEPIVFPSDPTHESRHEDGIIAFTWNTYIKNTSKADWLLRLPMVKACMKAMDATEQFVAQKNVNVTKWVAAGASKRGWTTWTLSAVEKRLIGIVPVVMDLLNLPTNMKHMWRNMGGWTFAFKDYYKMNLTAQLDDPALLNLSQVVDAYFYRDRLAGLPKLVVNAGDDEFFQGDDDHYWWDDMPGPKHRLLVQDSEHSMATGILEAASAIEAFAHGLLSHSTIPNFTWELDYTNGQIVVNDTSASATKIKLRYATNLNETRKDFRWLVDAIDGGCPSPLVAVPKKSGICFQPIFWHTEEIAKSDSHTYIGKRPAPDKAWTAFFVEMYYKGVTDVEYRFTTQMMILPNTFPFPPCSGEGCRGQLI